MNDRTGPAAARDPAIAVPLGCLSSGSRQWQTSAGQTFEHDPAPSPLLDVWPEMLTSPIAGGASGGPKGLAGRRRRRAAPAMDEFVRVRDWDTALDHVAASWRGCGGDHGDARSSAVSYGWSSAGRIHHARTLVRRFLFRRPRGDGVRITQLQLWRRDGIPAARARAS